MPREQKQRKREKTHNCIYLTTELLELLSVASPGFVTRRGKTGDYVMGNSRRASGPGAAAARGLIVL